MQFIKDIIRKLFIEDTPLQGYVAHIPHGLFIVFGAVCVHWVVALVWGYGFIHFELNQEKHAKDKACQDIAGMLLGVVIGSIIAFLIGIIIGGICCE